MARFRNGRAGEIRTRGLLVPNRRLRPTVFVSILARWLGLLASLLTRMTDSRLYAGCECGHDHFDVGGKRESDHAYQNTKAADHSLNRSWFLKETDSPGDNTHRAGHNARMNGRQDILPSRIGDKQNKLDNAGAQAEQYDLRWQSQRCRGGQGLDRRPGSFLSTDES